MNMPKSRTSPWCKLTNPETTSDSQEDSLDDRMVSGNDTTIDRHPYQVKIPGKYMIFPEIAELSIEIESLQPQIIQFIIPMIKIVCTYNSDPLYRITIL